MDNLAHRFGPLDETGEVVQIVEVRRDVTERKHAEEESQITKCQAEKALSELEQAYSQLLQSDKMASIGALAAGVALCASLNDRQ